MAPPDKRKKNTSRSSSSRSSGGGKFANKRGKSAASQGKSGKGGRKKPFAGQKSGNRQKSRFLKKPNINQRSETDRNTEELSPAIQGKYGRPMVLDQTTWNDKPSPALMRSIMEQCGIDGLTDLQINLLWQYHLRIRERNKEINITRIHSFPEVVVKHFVDCALVGRLTELPSPLMDLGSGGGFPGVPLKILHPEVSILLAEGRRLRVDFLGEVRKCLRLPQLYIYGHQVHPSCEELVRGVVTRAVEVIPKTLERISGCLCRGGRVIFMKGPNVTPEIKETESKMGNSYRLVEDHHFLLPSTDHKRRLVVFERLDGPEYVEKDLGDS